MRIRTLSAAAATAAVLAVGAVVATVGTAQDTGDALDGARPLGEWFSGATAQPLASADLATRVAAAPGNAEQLVTVPPHVALVDTPTGAPVLVRAAVHQVCTTIPGVGGACWGSGTKAGPKTPPVLVSGIGQQDPVDSSYFIALAGDGISSLTLDVEGRGATTVPVTNNAVFVKEPGRVLSWSWTSPDGKRQVQHADLSGPR
jgi:hypothetical protein